ncbi:THUMP domain-containing class I SAM-dependent RNA methyltransferase [Natranaerofaba carboxydovora]|uniref:THUMP domain-containing class I SAM-dependent RNA methyltransferase n=1 Tax=Natranaerofaba carboxydovora TaxID=2742683 RepID=UPI001F13225B|nr:class I SAM-dependent RNA methyltransferase [Natranaerofaba carboxydovora]UMZ75458.1 Ribosomal RNA large subunit methyltransferase L [Natranaerofaba carboxydovora]
MEQMNLVATSTFGLERVLADELQDLGYKDLEIENGKVNFKGDVYDICRTNLWLRTADRVKITVGEFEATSFEELFDKTYDLPWEDYIPADAHFPVEGKSVKSTLYSVPDCQKIVKKAVVEKLKTKYKTDWFEEEGPSFVIEVALLKDTASLTIDTTGAGLHKRGYRQNFKGAPLKETLAAGLVKLAKYKAETPLVDPFCGLGTIPIEAALIGKNLAPGLFRDFTFEDWPFVSMETFDRAREEADDLAEPDRSLSIIGTDIDEEVVKMARDNARQFGLEDDIHFQQKPLYRFGTKKKYGKIICNPPYGHRLEEEKQVKKLYKEMAKMFSDLETWSIYVLTPEKNFEKIFGKKAAKRRKLYNGRIEVHYYQYF